MTTKLKNELKRQNEAIENRLKAQNEKNFPRQNYQLKDNKFTDESDAVFTFTISKPPFFNAVHLSPFFDPNNPPIHGVPSMNENAYLSPHQQSVSDWGCDECQQPNRRIGDNRNDVDDVTQGQLLCIFVEPELRFVFSVEVLHPRTKRPILGESFALRFTEDVSKNPNHPGRPVTLLTASLWKDIITQMERIEGLVKTNAADAPTPERWEVLKDRWRRLADAVDEIEQEEGALPA